MTLNYGKTREMVVVGKTREALLKQISQINRKSESIFFGETKNEDPNNWDTQFDMMLHKANSRLHILVISRCYGYSMEDLTIFLKNPNNVSVSARHSMGLCVSRHVLSSCMQEDLVILR